MMSLEVITSIFYLFRNGLSKFGARESRLRVVMLSKIDRIAQE